MNKFISIFLILCSSFLCTVQKTIDDYAVVIDAGSTGSRCFVFHIMLYSTNKNRLSSAITTAKAATSGSLLELIDEGYNDHRNISAYTCGKVIPGLSAFSEHPDDASAYVAPLLHIAANRIPIQYHYKTRVYIKATAGFRLLTTMKQQNLWKRLVQGLMKREDTPFIITPQSVGTIDGHDEAFFAVLASNYIAGSIDGNLLPMKDRPLLGALDMGGGSTQLIFYNGTYDSRKVQAGDFWSHSYLDYGVVRVRQRVLDAIELDYYKQRHSSRKDNLDDSNSHKECRLGPRTIPNPCSFAGHQDTRRISHDYSVIFEGTGDAVQCLQIIERVIWPQQQQQQVQLHSNNKATNTRLDRRQSCLGGRPCPIDEIEHPSVTGHHFYAMSVYYYALDCMRELGPGQLEQWPTPSIDEVEEAALEFCGMTWEDVHEKYKAHPHHYTRAEQLHERCFEVLYIITLLEKGFGFHRDDRTITYALEVGGKEVEWTLGFALAEIDFDARRLLFSSHNTNEMTSIAVQLRVLLGVLESGVKSLLHYFPSFSTTKGNTKDN